MMTPTQIFNRIFVLADLALDCVRQGARLIAAEFYNLILRYQFRLIAV